MPPRLPLLESRGLGAKAPGPRSFRRPRRSPVGAGELDLADVVTLYFSLRSPYSWLALHRIDRLPASQRPPLALIPVYPRADAVEPATTADPARFRYVVEDMFRMATAYGLTAKPPASLDTRWELPHAAFLHAEAHGCGFAFALEASKARFTESLDVGCDDALGRLATRVGLDPTALVAAAHDVTNHRRVEAGIDRAREAGVFGVPTFVFRGQRFWGNDRFDWLLREIDRAEGRPIADLSGSRCIDAPWRPREG